MKTHFIMLIGIPGSGKSFMAQKLKERSDFESVSSDSIRAELFGDENDQTHNNEVFNEVHKRIQSYLRKGVSCVYDATNLSSKRRKAFLNTISDIDCIKYIYVMCTDLDICLKQNSQRDRVVPEDVIKSMLRRLQMPRFNEGWDFIHYEPNTHNVKTLAEYFRDTISFNQDNPNHSLALDQHLSLTSAILSEKYPLSSYIGLFHDIGKPFCKTYQKWNGDIDDHAHFYNHENVGAYFYSCAKKKFITIQKNSYISSEDVLAIICIQRHMDFYSFSKDNYEKDLEKYFDNLSKYFTETFFTQLKKILIELHDADMKAH